jgi:cellobiose phosphorylase
MTKLIKHYQHNTGEYFPLFNFKGLRSTMSPFWGGDLKLSHHHYATEPTTALDLYHLSMSRNIIFDVDGEHYFANGQTHLQQEDKVTVEADFLSHKIIRSNDKNRIEILSYIPLSDTVELHHIIFTNTSSKTIQLKMTTAIPLYSRSADNIRDHRHVTSLLNQTEVVFSGILNQPTLSFDERGHKKNNHIYSVFAQGENLSIKGYIPIMDDFMAGGNTLFPRGLSQLSEVGCVIQGYEAIGAIQFNPIELKPNQSIDFYVSIGIHEDRDLTLQSLKHLNKDQFNHGLEEVHAFFDQYLKGLSFEIGDTKMSEALSWVVLQPMLRRYFGNSYLPHHDYGRGGKGWRDLWQDLLALIMMNDSSVTDMLYNNFFGVRIDGSNATIIGDKPGEFKADRNMITRVWSDHGAWPLLTVKMYLDETGDLDFLLRKQGYFQDQFTHYTKKTRPFDTPYVKGSTNAMYQGTILEHLLLQNLVGHHNIGAHGFVKLEDADWNDGLDMAHEKGETIAFTHMFANNLRMLADIIEELDVDQIELFKEIDELFNQHVNLSHFFDQVLSFSGQTHNYSKRYLIEHLRKLADHRIDHLTKHAFFNERFQSYFDNQGKDVDDQNSINLTGQAMALLSHTATPEQAQKVAKTTREKLFKPELGGYQLNTNYHRVLTEMGRAYGFAYGHKENGAVFSHMVMMYTYGLYQYHLVKEGREAWTTLFIRALAKESYVFAGIPEYFTDRGIGMYPFLTGSASWFLKLLRTEVFGIQMRYGKLFLEPKLTQNDFIQKKASITTYLHGSLVEITYINQDMLDVDQYRVHKITMNGKEISQGTAEIYGEIEVILK